MKENCPNCQGKGWKGFTYHSDKCYKAICHRCCGKKKLDWIEIITGVRFGGGPLNIRRITNKLSKDNYSLIVPGALYFIQKEFFNPEISYADQFKYLSMIIQ
jgi:hypothetical protein